MQKTGKPNIMKNAVKILLTPPTALLVICGMVFLSPPAYGQAYGQLNIDSLEQVLATDPPTEVDELVSLYNDLSYEYLRSDLDKAAMYARKCVEVSIPADFWSGVRQGYHGLSNVHYYLSQFDSVELYLLKALDAAERMRDSSGKYSGKQIDDSFSSLYANMGNLYLTLGRHLEGLEYYTEALKLFEKHGRTDMVAQCYANIGRLYRFMENYGQAEVVFLKLDSLAHLTGNKFLIAVANDCLSETYLNLGEYDLALQNALAARDYYFANPLATMDQARIINILANIYVSLEDFTCAEEYARQALAAAEELGMPHLKVSSLFVLAKIHVEYGNWRGAEQTALAALSMGDMEPGVTRPFYEILTKAYAKLGDGDKVLEYFGKHNEITKTLSTQHYQSAIREIETKYETEKKEARIEALEDEKRLTMWLIVAGAGVVLLMLATLFLLWRWSAQKKRLAEQQVVRLEKEQQLVATQAVLDGETRERSRLARDLHDGLGSMLTGVKMHLQGVKDGALLEYADVERFDKALTMLDQSAREMHRVAHHLMPEALSRFGLKPALSDFCSTMPAVRFGFYGAEERLEPKMEMMIYSVVCELVNNALKHSGAGNIGVQLIQEPDRIAFNVQDDGCGFDPAAETSGMGLLNIRNRVASFGGIMDIDSASGRGTEINIELKI